MTANEDFTRMALVGHQLRESRRPEPLGAQGGGRGGAHNFQVNLYSAAPPGIILGAAGRAALAGSLAWLEKRALTLAATTKEEQE